MRRQPASVWAEMMAEPLNQEQYATPSKYNARVHLNKTFSTNSESKFRWIFRFFPQRQGLKVLEIGCGTGLFWLANHQQLPTSWSITLSDYSAGMLETARKALQGIPGNFNYALLDAQNIANPSPEYDLILANNMLYHLPDRPRAIANIRQLLRDHGLFLASTMGRHDLTELNGLLSDFLQSRGRDFVFPEFAFSLENGAQQLSASFPAVQRYDFPDSLVIDDTQAIVNYYLSFNGMHDGLVLLSPDEAEDFGGLLRAMLAQRKALTVQKSSGLFVCSQK